MTYAWSARAAPVRRLAGGLSLSNTVQRQVQQLKSCSSARYEKDDASGG